MENLRPSHYVKGADSFSWAERKFDLDTCLAIAAFNIHKYNDRDKGEDFKDFGKIADYANWARSMMKKSEEPSQSDSAHKPQHFGELR